MIPLFLRSDKVKVMIPPNPILIVHCILLHIYPSVSYRYIVRGGNTKRGTLMIIVVGTFDQRVSELAPTYISTIQSMYSDINPCLCIGGV